MSPRDRIDMWNKVWNNFAVVVFKKNKIRMCLWVIDSEPFVTLYGKKEDEGEEKFTLNAY